MRILSIDCSAGAASCAVIEDGKLIAESFLNIRLTHSQTLLPMITDMLKNSRLDYSLIDGYAITNGPGSFTGIRIGISAVKGLAFAENKPCVGVSTLRAMAGNLLGTDCIACAVMDARCNQFYNALFKIEKGSITRLTPDRALFSNELIDELNKNFNNEIIVAVGDGAELLVKNCPEDFKIELAPEHLRLQRASLVGLSAFEDFLSGNTVSSEQLGPFYLRLPQAERELLKKEGLVK